MHIDPNRPIQLPSPLPACPPCQGPQRLPAPIPDRDSYKPAPLEGGPYVPTPDLSKSFGL